MGNFRQMVNACLFIYWVDILKFLFFLGLEFFPLELPLNCHEVCSLNCWAVNLLFAFVMLLLNLDFWRLEFSHQVTTRLTIMWNTGSA